MSAVWKARRRIKNPPLFCAFCLLTPVGKCGIIRRAVQDGLGPNSRSKYPYANFLILLATFSARLDFPKLYPVLRRGALGRDAPYFDRYTPYANFFVLLAPDRICQTFPYSSLPPPGADRYYTYGRLGLLLASVNLTFQKIFVIILKKTFFKTDRENGNHIKITPEFFHTALQICSC